ncbi:hypothetical protein RFF05_04830 [Bengtsoniella intestinalis]|uniref:endonuclease/exonuclease/phosphatase family protein n=1 Tax=Bengtsoniella intestinalis TaxID=3073143 RepID=UPI00391F904E
MGYKIGSFNCLNMKNASRKDLSKMAEMIQTQEFDIIALQEIQGTASVKAILDNLGSHWKGKSDQTSYVKNTSHEYDYAFLWNTRRVDLVKTKLDNGQKRTYSPRIYKQYKIDKTEQHRKLNHEPYFARFTPRDCGGPSFEIRIINTHIRFSKYKSEAGEDTQGAITTRRNELTILTKYIYAKEADNRYGDNMPAYTILLGDYNLNLSASKIYGTKGAFLEKLEEVIVEDNTDSNKTKKIITVQSELTTLKKDTPADGECAFASNYDHFSYDQNRFQTIPTPTTQRINTLADYYNGNVAEHKKGLSDHQCH